MEICGREEASFVDTEQEIHASIELVDVLEGDTTPKDVKYGPHVDVWELSSWNRQ